MPAHVFAKSLTAALVFPGLLALAACGGLEWPPPSAKPRVANMPPVLAKSPTVPSAAHEADSHVVVRGESIQMIARRYQIPLGMLVEANGLEPPYRLVAGQRLVVPRGRDHFVAPGENLDAVAARYGLDRNEVARANGLAPPYELQVGQRLTLPPGSAPVVAASTGPVSAPLPPVTAKAIETVPLETLKAPVAPAADAPASEIEARPPKPQPAETAAAIPAAPVRSGRGFLWPVTGKIISGFGDKSNGMRNDGVNIAAAKGAPVVAVEDGVVTYAGNEIRGFGNLVLIKHEGGWITAYGHLDTLLVKRGDEIRKGDSIGRVGATGNVREPQLHFEIRRGKAPVDPLRHLPRARA